MMSVVTGRLFFS